jgi:hypothetical protein
MTVYSLPMAGFGHAPSWLVVLAITSIAVGVGLLALLVWHVVRRILDVPRIPRGFGTYAFMLIACVLLIAEGATSLAVAAALGDWQNPVDAGASAIAEVHCRRLGPSRVELRYATLGAGGQRGPEQTQTIAAASCGIAVERLRFHPPLPRLGLLERLRLVPVGTSAPAATTPPWRALPQPLGLPIASAEAQQLAIPTADDAPYRIVADDRGLRVEKLQR